jgi:hypothetical protein
MEKGYPILQVLKHFFKIKVYGGGIQFEQIYYITRQQMGRAKKWFLVSRTCSTHISHV